MKKHSTKTKVNTKTFFNRLGMTYIELLCALSLLSLIVVMFTPMLLSSYDTVYKAGERVENAYHSKEEIEDTLSTRLEKNTLTIKNFGLIGSNANKAFYSVEVTGKKVVSSLTKGLETVFGVSRAKVSILSPKQVYDDQDNQNVIIQIKGLKYNQVMFGSFPYADKIREKDFIKASKQVGGLVYIEIIIPDKIDKGSEQVAYTSTGIAKVKIKDSFSNGEIKYKDTSVNGENITDKTDSGKIYLNISSNNAAKPLDFTQSPVRIKIYYVDNRDKVRSTCDYLVIEPPTMLFAGETSSGTSWKDSNGQTVSGAVDYYTSPGVVEKGGVYKLVVNPRKMRIENSGVLAEGTDNPNIVGASINVVSWIDADESSVLSPYYVMAGKNSRIYRMYNYKMGANIDDAFPQASVPASMETKDDAFVLTDGTVAPQSFWSGDLSDQYYFRTENNASGYGAYDTNKTDCTRETQYNKFDKTLRYLMVFSGYRTGYSYRMQASRRISYILTEKGAYSFRFAGKKSSPEEYTGYTAAWEPVINNVRECFIGPGETQTQWTKWDENKWDVDPGGLDSRNIAGKLGSPYEKPIYFSNKSGLFDASQNKHYERNIAWLGAVSYTSIPLYELEKDTDKNSLYNRMFGVTSSGEYGGYFWPNKGNDDEYGGNDGLIENHLQTEHANKINILSAAYLPDSASDGSGQLIYFGTVPAFTLIRQSSDIGKPDRYVYNGKNIRDSRSTLYLVKSEGDAGTTIYRNARSNDNNMGVTGDAIKDLTSTTKVNTATEFYKKGNDNVTYYYKDDELMFTFGYCSRWRMTVGTVTSDGKIEVTKSYEQIYKDSNTSATFTRVPATLNGGDVNNLYYNVWFPGEHYNLTHTATLDEVTVAVGYAVSGSTFMEESGAITDNKPAAPGFYGTALGSIYNDGVLAAYVSKDSGGKVYDGSENDTSLDGRGERNTIFQNLLYYKSSKFEDSTLHSRENVRFTAVGLYTVAPYLEKDNSGTATVAEITNDKEYYAVYGDNKGKAYYSKIATSKITSTEQEDTASEHVTLCSGGNAVAATPVTAFKSNNKVVFKDTSGKEVNGMCEIKVDGNSLNTIFSEIKTITVANDIMIITGPQLNSETKEQLVIGTRTDDSSNDWSFKIIKNGGFEDVILSAKVIGEYYYICGNDGASSNWIAAVHLDTLRELPNGKPIQNESESDPKIACHSSYKNKLLWVSTPTKVFDFDGRDTRG